MRFPFSKDIQVNTGDETRTETRKEAVIARLCQVEERYSQ